MLDVYTCGEGRKPRLPSRFSWPMGLEQLSKSLEGIPQSGELRVWYWVRPMPHPNDLMTMEYIADQKFAYQIVTAWYSALGEPGWYLMIYPVESRLRRRAKELLEAEGIKRIREFLTRDHTETELMTSHHFRCIFDPVDLSLAYEHERG